MSDRETTGMLEEIGTVVEVTGSYAVIETQQRSACGQCSVSCGTSVLAGLFKNRRQRVRLRNHPGLRVGDRAVIGINESVLVSTAVMAYMLPLVLMILAAALSHGMGFGDGVDFLASMSGLLIGMRLANRIMGHRDFQGREIVLLRNADEAIMHRFDQQTV
jgi:sigma-E factor negative regulatory protein RseC